MEIVSLTSQRLSLSKNLVFSLKILAFNSFELFQFVDDIALSNPAFSFINRKFLHTQFSSENYAECNPLNAADALLEKLNEDIDNSRFTHARKKFLKDVIHHFLDEDFFLKRKEFLQKYNAQEYKECQRFFKNLKPSGIGACHLQERFKHQLEFYGLKESLHYKIVDECWKYFLSQKYIKIQKLLKTTEREVQHAIEQIKKKCKAKIIDSELVFSHHQHHFIYPDIILKKDGSLEINEHYLPKIKLNDNFLNLKHSLFDKEVMLYKKDKMRQARKIILAIEKRNQTLLKIGRIVIDFQNEYSKEPHLASKRLTLKDISLRSNLSQSTISRTLKNKTILTPNGIKTLRKLIC